MVAARPLLLALLASGAQAFNVLTSSNNSNGTHSLPYRWSAVQTLTWALAPDFCDMMRPLIFEDDSIEASILSDVGYEFGSCERIHAAIRNAFETWEANTPSVRFYDMTEQCKAQQLWVPIAEELCIESQYCIDMENGTTIKSDPQNDPTGQCACSPQPCSCNPLDSMSTNCLHATCFECDRADIIVGAFKSRNREPGDVHVDARITERSFSDAPPLGTNGLPAPGRTENRRVFMQFNAENLEKKTTDAAFTKKCWRLDNDLCSWLASRERSDTEIIATAAFAVAFAISLCICLCGCVFTLRRLAGNLLQGWDLDDDGKVELQEVLYVLDEFCGDICFECRCPNIHSRKMSILAGMSGVLETITQLNVISILVVFVPMLLLPIVFFYHVESCWRCQDLHAAVAHQIGHLLSLDHANITADGAMGFNTSLPFQCTDPDANVLVGELPLVLGAGESYPANYTAPPDYGWVTPVWPDALMREFGLYADSDVAAQRCLGQDDLDGLNFLYPACVNQLATPVCRMRAEGQATSLRILRSFGVLFAFPFAIFVGLKLFAKFCLLIADLIAMRTLGAVGRKSINSIHEVDEGFGKQKKRRWWRGKKKGETAVQVAAPRLGHSEESTGPSEGAATSTPAPRPLVIRDRQEEAPAVPAETRMQAELGEQTF